jgi:hypothetical protein
VSNETTAGPQVERGFELKMMFHPSHRVPDLGEAERFFERVFGCPSTPMATMMRSAPPREGYPTDYSTFTPIRDVFFDTIDPKRYVYAGVQRYPTVDEPHLNGFGWYIEGVPEAYRELKRRGIRMTDQFEDLVSGDDPPMGGTLPMFFTYREDTGLRYQFMPVIPMPADPRTAADWVLPPVSAEDPLGIVRCSHHTVLTDRPERALALVVDALGGTILHEGRNELLGATSTYVHLADGVLEYAVPDSGTPAQADWAREADDTYHSITWQVVDMERTEHHLADEGVAIRARSANAIQTDPATSLGIPWGFSTTLVPGDSR